MPIDPAELTRPGHTAVVTSELQGSVVGDASLLPALRDAAGPAVAATARLCVAARAAGVDVVHCVAARRADGRGSNTNARLFAAMNRDDAATMTPGSDGASVVPDLGPDERDLVLSRLHGLNPMAGTDLDPVLRNLGVSTIIVTGVSVNIAVTNLVMDAVNAGYQVVLPRDAVAGVPPDYAEALIDNTLSLLATITTTADLIATWTSS